MSNFYQHYYQSGNYKAAQPGMRTKLCVKGIVEDNKKITSRQKDYFYALLNFLKQNGIDTTNVERPRNNRDCSSKIATMNTLLRKNGLYDKFYSKEGEQDGQL